MEAEHKRRRLRLLTGTVAEVEEQLNRMLDEYAATVWSFAPVDGVMHCTVVLLMAAELRKAALMRTGGVMP